jgi:hypothetical protein
MSSVTSATECCHLHTICNSTGLCQHTTSIRDLVVQSVKNEAFKAIYVMYSLLLLRSLFSAIVIRALNRPSCTTTCSLTDAHS